MALIAIYDKDGKETMVHSVDATEACAGGVYSMKPKSAEEKAADDKIREESAKVMTPDKKPDDVKRAYNKKG